MDHTKTSKVSSDPEQTTSPLLSTVRHENWTASGEVNVRKFRYLQCSREKCAIDSARSMRTAFEQIPQLIKAKTQPTGLAVVKTCTDTPHGWDTISSMGWMTRSM